MCSVLVEPRLTLYVSRFVIHLVFLLSKYKVWSLYCYIRVCDLFISLPLANWCNYNFHVRLNCFRSATLTQPQLCSPVGFKSALVSSQIHVKGFGAYNSFEITLLQKMWSESVSFDFLDGFTSNFHIFSQLITFNYLT